MPQVVFEISFDGVPAVEALYDDLAELEVVEDVDGAGSFSLRLLASPDDRGVWSYLDDERFSLYTTLDLAIGFGDSPPGAAVGPQPLLRGYVTNVDLHAGADVADGSLTIRGRDRTVLLGLEEKVVAWPNTADGDIARQILARQRGLSQVSGTTPVREETETVVIQRGSDADFLRHLARRNGFEFRYTTDITGEHAYFGPPRLDGAPQKPDLAVRFGDRSNLLSFDATVNGVQPLAVAARQLDPHTKQVASAEATSTTLEPLAPSGLETLVEKVDDVVTPLEQQGRLLLAGQPSANAVELRAVSQAVRDRAEWLVVARGEVKAEAYGGVLRAGRTVLVKGAGDRYSGTYYVTRVTHRIDSERTYRQTFEARRTGLGLDGSERFGAASSLDAAVATQAAVEEEQASLAVAAILAAAAAASRSGR